MHDTQGLCECRIIHHDRVVRAHKAALPEKTIEAITETFKAMGDQTRLKILQALGTDEMCVCDLAAYLDLSQSAVSHQLKILRQLRLVSNRREGQVLYYRLNDNHVNDLLQVALEHVNE